MQTNLELGDPGIDRQHDELFARFDSLISAGISADLFSDALSDLTVQICAHFCSEELFMETLDLPEVMYRAHCKEHIRIIEEVTDTHFAAMHGHGIPHKQAVAKIASWVVQHLVEYDLSLRPHIEAKQVQPQST